jgi:O-antigen/teichoic acid export membrane protein
MNKIGVEHQSGATSLAAERSHRRNPHVNVLETRQILARNTLWNYGGFAVNVATNLIMFPYVVSRIGDAAAGVWLLLGAVTGYMGLLEVGIVPSLAQAVAASHGRGDLGAISRAASSARTLLWVLAVAALSLVFAVHPLVAWLEVGDSLASSATAAFRVCIVGVALRMPLAMYQAILLGRQRQDRCNQLWILIGFTKFLAAAIVLWFGGGLLGLVAAEVGVHLLAGVLQVRWAYQAVPDLHLSWRLVSVADARALLAFGGAMMAVSVSSLIIEQTDRLVIAAFLPLAMVTSYAAAWKLYMLAFALTTTLVQAVAPVAAELHGRNNTAALRRLFLRTTRYTTTIAWPLASILGLTGGVLLRLWMGPRFEGVLPVVQVLVAAFAVTALNHAGYSVLVGMRRVGGTVARYFAPQAAMNLVLSVLLVQPLGIAGVALGTLIPAFALEYVFVRFVLRELGLTWTEFLNQAVRPVLRPMTSFLPLALTYTIAERGSPMLLVVAAACAVAFVIAVCRRLEADERTALITYMPAAARPPLQLMLAVAGRARLG